MAIKTSSSVPDSSARLMKLTALGFTREDSNSIISKEKYTQVAEAIENKYEEIIALGLNQAVVKIALSRGGTRSLPVALDKFQQLQKLGFNKDAIIKIASNSGTPNWTVCGKNSQNISGSGAYVGYSGTSPHH